MSGELNQVSKQIAFGMACRRQNPVYATQIGPPAPVSPDRDSQAAACVVELEQFPVIEHEVVRSRTLQIRP